jgi:RNA polymerase sigma factor (TIGR02999 family)
MARNCLLAAQLTGQTSVATLGNQKRPFWGIFVGQNPTGEITQLLAGWRGDRQALDALLPVVYKELRRLAHFQLGQERSGHTLQSAALVNEAYLRLVGLKPQRWESRTHFFAIAAQLMRQILVDYARRHRAKKRGGGAEEVPLEDANQLLPGKDIDIVALDDALKELAKIDPRKAQVVELRFFGGLSFDEAAEVLNVSPVTVSRDWSTARAWLHREIDRGHRDGC